jgi:hypothetical protein
VSAQPPSEDPPAAAPQRPPGTIRCPRCSAELSPDQGWCLECGAPARTRLAPTPNWQLPTAAVAVIVLIAGALLAFAFVKLTGDDSTTAASTAPVIATQPPAAPPPVTTTATTPATVTQPTTPQTTTQPPTTLPGQTTTPPGPTTTVPQPNLKRPKKGSGA